MVSTTAVVGVLGSSGFIGSNLILWLEANNIKCVGGSRRSGIDARNTKSVIEWIIQNDINCVVNLAAKCGGIGANKVGPADFWSTTTQIASAVLEACVFMKVDKVVNIGTICSYPSECPVPFQEESLLHYGKMEETNLAYGIAKLNYLFGAQAYKKQYGLNTINILPVNMYGPCDNFDLDSSHVIPAMIRKFYSAYINNETNVTLWGDGTPTREFLFVNDFCDAIVKIINICNVDEFINIGSGHEISIANLASTIATIIGYHGSITWNDKMPNGQMRRCLDTSKAKRLFGFEATTTIEDGLQQTIQWWKNQKAISTKQQTL